MKIKCEILATFRNNPYLCSVKCMFDYPGRIPRGASLIDNALGARHHDTTPFLKPSPQGMVFLSLICFLKHMEECFFNCHMAHNRNTLTSFENKDFDRLAVNFKIAFDGICQRTCIIVSYHIDKNTVTLAYRIYQAITYG